jgi:DNA polymerase I-like protein with 3'-5' exonuclease and polymerase domains
MVPLSLKDSKWNRSVKPVNYPIQGSGSDVVTHFMAVIARTMRGEAHYLDMVGRRAADAGKIDVVQCVEEIGHRGRLRSHVINSIHDSVLNDVTIDELDVVVPIMRFIMEDTTDFPWMTVPLKADTAIGESIGQKIELDPYKFSDHGGRIGRAGVGLTV